MRPFAGLTRARRWLVSGIRQYAVFVASASIGLTIGVSTAGSATESVLHSFKDNGADGAEPYAGVIVVKGILYGTTARGGTGNCTQISPHGCGTVFKVNPRTGAETVLYSFQNNGADGELPNGLIQSGISFYGTTTIGGSFGGGAVFSVNRKTGAETVLHSFQGAYNDGDGPEAAPLDVNGMLYGTTSGGGSVDEGTVYSLDLTTGKDAILHSFCNQCGGDDGSDPHSVLINVNGFLYGTTELGGTVGDGTVFSLDPSNGTETVLYSFCQKENCEDGETPNGSLTNVRGKLYGTTTFGGAFGHGTIYSVDLSAGKEKVLYSFQGGQDGAKPIGGMGLLKVGDIFYGTTGEGGGNGCGGYGCGTVFAFDRNSGAETVLHAFRDDGADGNGPVAGVIDVNGTLYGTTVYGGKYGYGTVFDVVP